MEGGHVNFWSLVVGGGGLKFRRANIQNLRPQDVIKFRTLHESGMNQGKVQNLRAEVLGGGASFIFTYPQGGTYFLMTCQGGLVLF